MPSSRLPFDDDPTPAAVITAAAVAATADEPTRTLSVASEPASSTAVEPPSAPADPTAGDDPARPDPEPATLIGQPAPASDGPPEIAEQSSGYAPLPAGPPRPVSGTPYQQLIVPPRPKRRWGVMVAFASVAVAMLCLLPAGAVAVFFVVSTDRDQPGEAAARPPDAVGAPGPDTDAPPTEHQSRIRDQLNKVLARQTAALLAGDESGYLAAIDPQAVELRGTLTRQYRSLRAMRVASWRDEVSASSLTVVAGAAGRWKGVIASFSCFVTAPCPDGIARTDTEWLIVDNRVLLVASRPVLADLSPHPWQVSELQATAGARTVVATTAQYAGHLPKLLAQAEKAALVADRYARPGLVPIRYVIYFAGPAEWLQWFAVDVSDWYGGVAVNVSVDRYDLMLNGETTDPSYIGGLLRHELTHASSLPGLRSQKDELWWLMEGLAEFAQLDDAGIGQLDRAAIDRFGGAESTRRLIGERRSADMQIAAPADAAAEWEVEGHYGLAFLGAACISEVYGHDRLINFFHAVVHGGQSVSKAATLELGEEWSAVNAGCDSYIRAAVGLT